jgi:hypothetical protein
VPAAAGRTLAAPGTALEYAPGVESDDAVVVEVVSGETEAEIVCGLLRSAGFECGYRDTAADDSALEEFIASGPRDILVHARDLEAARAVLGEAERRADTPLDLPPGPGH